MCPAGFGSYPARSGAAQLGELPQRERESLLAGLVDLDSTSDVILIDTAAGASSSVLGFLRVADLAVVVTTPEPTAITDAYSLIKRLVQGHGVFGCKPSDRPKADLGEPPGDVRLVVNQAIDSAEAESVYRRIERVCGRFLGVELGFSGAMWRDRAVPEAVGGCGTPLCWANRTARPRYPWSGSRRRSRGRLNLAPGLDPLRLRRASSDVRRVVRWAVSDGSAATAGALGEFPSSTERGGLKLIPSPTDNADAHLRALASRS